MPYEEAFGVVRPRRGATEILGIKIEETMRRQAC